MWTCREEALEELAHKLAPEADAIRGVFSILDGCISGFGDLLPSNDFAWACGIALTKGRHLGKGCFSLMLDGLGQEAGALLRPLVESIESLSYFRKSPERSSAALAGRHPEPGKVAKRIDGQLFDVRKHLNEHASHLAFSVEAVKHMFDPGASRFRAEQTHDAATLKGNLRSLFFVLMSLASEGVLCLSAAGHPSAPDLASEMEACRGNGLGVFEVAGTST
jgi:hypothetical protein